MVSLQVTVKHNKFVGAAGKPASQTTLLVREPSLDQKRKLKEHENKRTYTITQPEFDQVQNEIASNQSHDNIMLMNWP